MRRKILGVVMMLAVSSFIGATAQAQEQEREQEQKQEQAEQRQQEAPPAAKDVILRFIGGVGNKLVTAAEGFPEELYEYKPNEEVRTFGEILLHIARSNDMIVSRIAHRPPSDLKQFAYTNKAAAVATLKQSFATVVEAIEQNADPKGMPAWLYAVNHGSEHYGNLVVYYRLNGLVPPASR